MTIYLPTMVISAFTKRATFPLFLVKLIFLYAYLLKSLNVACKGYDQ